jgi:hypothetical protein
MAETRVLITAEGNQAIREFERVRAQGSGALSELGSTASGQLNRTTVSAAQTAAALRQVPAQFTDIVVSLQAGQAPLTVLLQQGGQLRDMFGSTGGAARALGGYVVGLVNPYTVAAAAAVTLAVAHRAGTAEAEGYTRALATTNNAAGATSNGMADVARNVGAVAGSQHDAAAAVTALAATGRVSAQDLQRFTQLAIDGQDVLGRSIKDTVSEFADIGRDPVAALEKLNEKYNFVTAAVYAQVKALKAAGRESEAASVAQNALADTMAGQRDQVLAVLSDWELGWMRIKKASSGVLDDVINLAMGRQKTADQQINALLTERELIEKRITVAVSKGDAEKERSFRADLARNAVEINGIRGKQDAEKAAAAAKAAEADANAAGIKWAKEGDQYLTRELAMQRDITAARALGATAGKSQVEIDKRVADIRKNYSDIYNDGINSQIESIKRRGSVEEIEAKRSMDLLSSNHSAGLVNERDYIQQVAKGEDAAFQRERDRLEKELALTARKQGSKKDQAALSGQIDEVDAQRRRRAAKEVNDLNELEVRGARQAADNYANLVDKQYAVVDGIAKQITTQKEYNEQIGLTKEGVARLAAARLAEGAARADEAAKYSTGELAAKYRDEAQALRDLADAQKVGAAKTTISDKFSPKDLEDFLDPGKAKSFGDSLKDAFGSAGDSLTKLRVSLQDYGIEQTTIERARAAAAVAFVGDSTKLASANETIARKETIARVSAYGSMAGAAKGFFKESSSGYKVLETTEKAFRAYETALALEAMVKKVFFKETEVAANLALNTTKVTGEAAATGASVALAGTEASAWGVTAVVKALASLPFPLNLAAGAVTLAAVLALGAKVMGGSGGTVDVAKERQEKAGTGTVLGNETAKSESIGKSIENLEKYASIELSHTRDMLSALVKIRDTIGVVAAMASQTSGLRATALDEKKYGVGSSSGVLGIGASSTTIQDSGIKLNGGQTVGDAISSGVDASGYADILKKNSGLWGIGASSKTRRDVIALDDDLKNQFGLLVGSMRDGAVEAVKVLGLSTDGIVAKINGMALGIDEISFKGLTGDEIQKELEAVFSKVGDDIAKVAVPELAQFQKVGEGYLETLTRVATNYATLDSLLAATGRDFGAVGLGSIAAREELIKLSGGLDQLATNTQDYAENYLTEAQRLAPVQKYVTEQLAGLGVAGITTRDQFKETIDSLDLTTEAGAKQYAGLMNLEAAFAKVYPAIEATGRAALSAADILSQKNDLQGQLDSLTLTSVQQLAKARDNIAEVNLALYDQVQAIKALNALDEARANVQTAYYNQRDALKEIVDLRTKEAEATLKQIDALKLSDLSTMGPEQKYLEAKRQFDAAAPGDAKNAAAQTLLQASRNYNGSTEAYARDYAKVQAALALQAVSQTSAASIAQQQMDALEKQVGELVEINAGVTKLDSTSIELQKAILGLGSAMLTSAAANTVAGLPNTENGAALGQNAVNGVLTGIYKDLLGRTPDAEGLKFWSAVVASGQTYDQIIAGIKGSPEYKALHGVTAHENGGIASGWSLVGEKGPELVNFAQPGRVYTASQTRSMMSGGESTARAIAAQTAAIERQNVLLAKQNDLLVLIKDAAETGVETAATGADIRSLKQHMAKTISSLVPA